MALVQHGFGSQGTLNRWYHAELQEIRGQQGEHTQFTHQTNQNLTLPSHLVSTPDEIITKHEYMSFLFCLKN